MSLVQTSVSGFPEYHKIETLFDRDERFVVDPRKIRKPVFATIREWDVTEKIDGTNIRIALCADGTVKFGGRTDNAQLPADLLLALFQMFPADRLRGAFRTEDGHATAVLYGEGYGAGIQKGGAYRADKSFILFDVLVGGKWWLDWDAVKDIAGKLGVDVVPYLGRMTIEQIVDLVREPFLSRIGTAMAEGIVARPIETLYDKKGSRVILKLKTKDFISTAKGKPAHAAREVA